jgi:PAS domain S-box-containing protein
MYKMAIGVLAVLGLFGLYAASVYNYLLFHTTAEVFSIVIACGIFMVAWNTRRYSTNQYLVNIGIAYLFIAVLDFFHTLSFAGMNIFVEFDANAPTQLWIAARYTESLTLLAAPLLMHRRIKSGAYFLLYGAIVSGVLLSVFYWQNFPDCFLADAGGLTPFKIVSEYIICLILFSAGALFIHRRHHFDPGSLKWLLMSIGTTILAELAFTTYGSVYSFSNLLGHYFKIVSFFFMYKAVIETGLSKPYNLLFRDLHQQREWLRVTLESIGDAVIATDVYARITFMNNIAAGLTGWSIAEAIGKPVEQVIHIVNEDTREQVPNPVRKVLATGGIELLANHTILLRKGGGELPIDDSAAPILDKDGRMIGVVLVFRDISERRQAEAALQQMNQELERRVAERTELAEGRAERLQNLSIELIEAEERERRKFAELLHDDLQQLLAAAKMQLQAACETAPAESLLPNVECLLNESIQKTRGLSHELNPPVLHNAELASGLEWLVRHMEKQFGLLIELQNNNCRPVENAALKVFLYRAIKELLFNTVKHAATDSARLVLSNVDQNFVITVSDRGQGFDPGILDSSSKPAGLGLLSLRERVRNIGGRLRIESSPGKGSRFTLSVPLSLSQAAPPSADRQSDPRSAPCH